MIKDTWLFLKPSRCKGIGYRLKQEDVDLGFISKEEINQVLYNYFLCETNYKPFSTKEEEKEKELKVQEKVSLYFTLKEEELQILDQLI